MNTIKHHVYVIPGIVDGNVVRAQAERNRDKKGEKTIVHAHAETGGCSDKCMVYRPGYLTHSIATEGIQKP